MGEILAIEKLNYRYKEKDILKKIKNKGKNKGIKDISFSLKTGKIVAILGLNGAGKTTTLKIILGLNKKESGEIKILGKTRKERELEVDIAEKVAYLPEISYYPKNFKVIDLLNYYSELYSIPKKERKKKIEEVLKKVNLLHLKNKKIKEFSKGMMQKIGLAQTLLNNPKLIFLDEPMSGLDPISKEEVKKMFLETREKGATIVFNTHSLEDVELIADQIIILSKGEVIDNFSLKDKKEKGNFELKKYFFNLKLREKELEE